MNEFVDRRVLTGFRCVDAITGSSVLSALSVTGAPLTIRPTQSGVFAVMDGPGMRKFTGQFLPDPASWPPSVTFEVTIKDPSSRYLPRRANIIAPQPLPAAPPPATAGTTTTTTTTTSTTTTTTVQPVPPQPQPIATPQDILLYPVTAAPMAPNWAVIRAQVVNTATPPAPLQWAVIFVMGPGLALSGLTNQNGEAVLAVPGLGLKLGSSSTGAITESTTPVTVTAYFDPAIPKQPKGWIPNPDDILLNLSSAPAKSAPQAVQLAPGQTTPVTLAISV